ncbi:hypothetical protein HKW66_Vig0155870 [Vigna angularis]|uniref:RING-type E3 ubiquitin transferase n=1 Tax=Phaseolus angularis TaxID=3914 RepID=A0A8T0JLC5_PHAAN|nr:hypothetical protein HKW66_Vig0155870 [Vigna angularis]
MTVLGMNRRFSYNISLSGENDINDLMPTALFRFKIRVFYESTSVPAESIKECNHVSTSTTTLFDTTIIDRLVNTVANEIRGIFHIDDHATTSSESQPSEIPLWIVINVTDSSMHTATQYPLRTVPAAKEPIDTLLKKSTVLQTKCCCCICLDEFDLNAECYTLPCQHFFHQKCITRWLHTSQTCPMCRQPLQTLKD